MADKVSKFVFPVKSGNNISNKEFEIPGVNVDASLSDTSTNPVQNKVVKTAIDGKSNTGHNHDDRYYTEAEVNDIVTTLSNADIQKIERNGTTFTVTRKDGTTFTFNQQDSDTKYSNGTGLNLSGTTFSVKYGTAAGTACQGNDSRLSDSRNAKDVSAWAKATSKPTYTASEVGAIATTTKGTANGVAELDANGKVPSSQLPSFVDDTIEGYLYNSKWYKESTHTTEIAGETGKIYVELSTNKTYRWSGSAFIEISASLALGETSSTAYRGDRGKIAYDHSQSTHARTDATKTEASSTNGNIKINGTETKVYTHPGSGTNPHGTTKSDVGLGNVGNFKAVSTVASQGLSDTEKANARANIGAGTGNSNLALGTSSSTAYRGDYGNSAYAHASAKGSAFSSGLYKITTNSEGHVTGATAVTKADITGLGIPGNDTWRGIQNNLTSDSTTDSLSAAQGKALANGSARDSTKLPAIIGYYGSDTAGTNGWYKVCTVSQAGYSDFAINLLFTQGYSRQATGLLHVHTRCENGTAIKVETLKWMYRYGFSADDVKLVTGNNTWSLYVQQINGQYGRIQVQVISKMGTSGDITFTLANNTTKESATPGGTAATDGGIVAYAKDAGTVNGKTVAVNVPANAKFTDTNTLNTAGSTDTSDKIFLIGAKSQAANSQTYSHDTAYVGTDGCLYSNNKKVLTDHQNISGKANLASPAFTGTPTAPTASANTNTTQIATTAFVQTAVSKTEVLISNSGDAYSSSKAYAVGELCIYNNVLYRCITACSAGSWATNRSCFIQDTLINNVNNIKNSTGDFATVNTTYFNGSVKVYRNYKTINIVGDVTAIRDVPNDDVIIANHDNILIPAASIIHTVAYTDKSVIKVTVLNKQVKLFWAGSIPTGKEIFFNITYLCNI